MVHAIPDGAFFDGRKVGRLRMQTDNGKLGLAYEAAMPIEVIPLAQAPDPAEAAAAAQATLSALRTITALDEQSADRPSGDAENLPEMARLELKVNILLDLVSELVSHHVHLPPARVVRLGIDQVAWRAEAPLDAGTHVSLQLYPQPGYPRPLRFLASVERCETRDSGVVIVSALAPQEEAVSVLLERLIFRQHRRQIAHARAQKGS